MQHLRPHSRPIEPEDPFQQAPQAVHKPITVWEVPTPFRLEYSLILQSWAGETVEKRRIVDMDSQDITQDEINKVFQIQGACPTRAVKFHKSTRRCSACPEKFLMFH